MRAVAALKARAARLKSAAVRFKSDSATDRRCRYVARRQARLSGRAFSISPPLRVLIVRPTDDDGAIAIVGYGHHKIGVGSVFDDSQHAAVGKVSDDAARFPLSGQVIDLDHRGLAVRFKKLRHSFHFKPFRLAAIVRGPARKTVTLPTPEHWRHCSSRSMTPDGPKLSHATNPRPWHTATRHKREAHRARVQ